MNTNPLFSDELQLMYRKLLAEQHGIAYAKMMAAFAAAQSTSGSNPGTSNAFPFSLDSEIPREEIECDIEIILVKSLHEGLKKQETNLNGLHGKKYGFREVVELANSRPAYPASPSVSMKRNRTTSFGTPESSQKKSDEEGVESKKPCIADVTNSSLDDSNASNLDIPLQIDWTEPDPTEPNQVKSRRMKNRMKMQSNQSIQRSKMISTIQRSCVSNA